MTTIVVKAFADRVEILSDGGLTNSVSGAFQLLEKVNKVTGSIWAPIAVAGTGPTSYSKRVADAVTNWSRAAGGSVDATIERVREELARQRKDAGPPLQPSRMLLAGISETKGPCVWEFVNYAGTTPAPWTLAEHGQCIRLFGSHPTPEEEAALDDITTLADYVPVMDAFRARWRRQCNSHVDLTTIWPYGVETRRLRVWDEDVIGAPMVSVDEWLASGSGVIVEEDVAGAGD
ncbi:hypothetical protein [Devosia salina]|uniref:PNPLA domain-containing protein n=1 Tax=Devosia salina TaxID=2860336 RepID=A0ABX8WCP8_9HYPH|nr:hypothetical protein [Devosia salina]QYO75339.1 hypothetical protein K1X15_11835 [Devosia salina]